MCGLGASSALMRALAPSPAPNPTRIFPSGLVAFPPGLGAFPPDLGAFLSGLGAFPSGLMFFLAISV